MPIKDQEKRKEYLRKWRLANKDKIAQQHKEWSLRNPDKHTQHSAKWKKRNPEKQKAWALEYYRNKHKERKEWMDEIKRNSECKTCGEKRIACLEFHHRNPKEKERNVATVIRDWSKERILKEISKCDVLCRNCHAVFHWGNEEDTT